jgi:hypothetical protein
MRTVRDLASMRTLVRVVLAFALLVSVLVLGLTSGRAATHSLLDSDVPAVVADGHAVLLARHDASAVIRLNIGLELRDQAGLDAYWKAMTTPGNPAYGRHLTKAQYRARFAPSPAAIAAASAWLTAQGLTVTSVTADRLLIHARAPVRTIQRAFGLAINDYRRGARTFYANDRAPTVPPGLHVHWISGLNNANVYSRAVNSVTSKITGIGANGIRKAYDIQQGGSGLTIGLTLWGRPLPQSDFNGYAAATNTTPLVVNQAGDDGINWVQIDGNFAGGASDGEVALDTEVVHGVAPGSHLTYFLGGDSSDGTMEDVLNTAANAGLDVISNSWTCQVGLGCSPDRNQDSIIQMGAMLGTNWFFGTGDSGAIGESFPTSSPYVVAVGGTNLSTDGSGNYAGETVWNLAGAGCGGNNEPWPTWQGGINAPDCIGGRAFPDVSANAGSNMTIFVNGNPGNVQGTSGATPIWAGAVTAWNENNTTSGRPKVPFLGPLIYELAENFHASQDFHDVTSGSNGLPVGPGWDEASGWGSADFNKLANNPTEIHYTGALSADKGETVSLSAEIQEKFVAGDPTHFPRPGAHIYFGVAGEFCDDTADNSGVAQCDVTIQDDPGRYKVIPVFPGDDSWLAVSQTKQFVVNHIPTKFAYTGATTAEWSDQVTLAAELIDDGSPNSFTKGDGIPNEPVQFHVGAESCSTTTGVGGFASCSVKMFETPGTGPYPIHVSFPGDSPIFEPSQDSSHSMIVKKEDDALSYDGATAGIVSEPVTADALLIDPFGGAPIVGKSIHFQLGATDSCDAFTGADGRATCQLTPTQAAGDYALKVSFLGDAFYESISDSSTTFTIQSAQSNTKNVQTKINSLIPGTSNPVKAQLTDAAKKLADALDPGNFTADGSHLVPKKGEHVFDDERDAVAKLLELLNHGSLPAVQVQPLIDKLVLAAESLADTAIADAVAGNGIPQKIAQAKDERAKATTLLGSGNVLGAIDHLKNAWHRAEEALKLL